MFAQPLMMEFNSNDLHVHFAKHSTEENKIDIYSKNLVWTQ